MEARALLAAAAQSAPAVSPGPASAHAAHPHSHDTLVRRPASQRHPGSSARGSQGTPQTLSDPASPGCCPTALEPRARSDRPSAGRTLCPGAHLELGAHLHLGQELVVALVERGLALRRRGRGLGRGAPVGDRRSLACCAAAAQGQRRVRPCLPGCGCHNTPRAAGPGQARAAGAARVTTAQQAAPNACPRVCAVARAWRSRWRLCPGLLWREGRAWLRRRGAAVAQGGLSPLGLPGRARQLPEHLVVLRPAHAVDRRRLATSQSLCSRCCEAGALSLVPLRSAVAQDHACQCR